MSATLLTLALLLPAQAPVVSTRNPSTAILEAKAEGRYHRAYDLAVDLLRKLAAGERLDAGGAADLAFALELADNLAVKMADHRGFAAILGDLAARTAVRGRPLLESRVLHARARHLFFAGEVEKARRVLDDLGYLRDFLLLGPLDNERGSGFRRLFPPEKAPGRPFDLGTPVEGKKRPQRFRTVEASAPLAHLDLGARFEPNTQVLGICAFRLTTDRPRELALRIGSTGSLLVRVDGVEVLRREVLRRPLDFDQDVAGFRVEAGDHLVLVKVCTREGPFAVRMRLTAADGGPLPEGVAVDASKAGLERAFQDAGNTSGTKPIRASRGVEDLFEARLGKLPDPLPEPGTEGARKLGMEAFRYGMILAMHPRDDESVRRDRKFARLATQLLPDFGPAFHLYGYTLIPRRSSEADREENARRLAYEKAIAAWPRNAESMRALAQMENDLRDNTTKAETWIDRALGINPEYMYARLLEIKLFENRDITILGERELDRLLAGPTAEHPEVLDLEIDRRALRDDIDGFLALLRKRLARRYESRVLLRLARTLEQRGESEEASKLMKRALLDFPQKRAVYRTFAKIHLGRGEPAAAARIWNAWLEIRPEDAEAWVSLARIAARMGKKDRQKETLERAFALNPNLKDVQRQLEYLAAGTKPFYDGREIDASTVLTEDGGPDPDSKAKGDSHYYLLKHVLVRAYRDGTTSRYEHLLVKILNEKGATDFDVWQPTFSGTDQTARILEATVVHEDGRKASARLGRAYYVDLPPLRPGDLVEIKARVDDRSPSFFGDYFGLFHLFHGDEAVPVHRSVLDLVLDPGRKYHFRTKGKVGEPSISENAEGCEVRRYDLRNLPRPPVESNAPSLRETGPWVQVSTYGTWDEFASWWWNLIRKQTIPTPEIKAKVAELTKDAGSLEEKLRKIYDFVVTDIRYKAWEFGVHGYKPYSVGAIYARRHGDCKDKAILLNTMLGEIGLKAYPVLIHAVSRRERDDLSLPLVEHFNHCISWFPAQKGLPERYLDGTAEYHPVDTLPDMDRGARVLVVREGKGTIKDIPWTDPLDNRNEVVYRVRLAEDGSAEIERIHRPHRNFAPPIRMRFGNEVGKRRQHLSDTLGNLFGKVEILDFEFSNLANLDEEVEYRVRFKVENFAAVDDRGMRVKAAFRPRNLVRLTAAAERRMDLLLTTPSSYDLTIEYLAPEGWKWADAPKDRELERKGIGASALSVSLDGRKLTVKRMTVLASQRIPSASWSEFQELAREIDRQDRTTFRLVRVRKEGGK